MKTLTKLKDLISIHFNESPYFIFGKKYHSILSEELSPWYCYTIKGGHSILALISGNFSTKNPNSWPDELIPCPIKLVTKDYRILKGFPVIVLDNIEITNTFNNPDNLEF
ncbi:MAG: hypothetical protein LBF27_01245 [Sphingobacterium sp.]|jgi:hypothetical protein|nr:hypothetical protein [Sphingobacterium sp.]